MIKRKLRMGMVGGGRGAFIGGVHRRAANLDGNIELPIIQTVKIVVRIHQLRLAKVLFDTCY